MDVVAPTSGVLLLPPRKGAQVHQLVVKLPIERLRFARDTCPPRAELKNTMAGARYNPTA